MFVVAMWEATAGASHGCYNIFNISLDTGKVTETKQLVDTGTGRVTFSAFMANNVDQRTAINLAGGWLWFGFAAYLAGTIQWLGCCSKSWRSYKATVPTNGLFGFITRLARRCQGQ